MSDNIQLTNLDDLLKNQNIDYSIFRDNFSIETAFDGAKHYGISLAETTPTLFLIFLIQSQKQPGLLKNSTHLKK